jgi:Uma2 family endonuclease
MLTFEHPSKNISLKEYFEIEDADDEKHEYFEGKVIFMKGAQLSHNQITVNLVAEITTFLKQSNFSVFPSALRVATPLSDAYMYPDVTIVDGNMQKNNDAFDTCINPSVIIEVMSESTYNRDMGYKFFYYQQIPSFKEYVLVDSSRCFVMTARRQEDNAWKFKTIEHIHQLLTIHTIKMLLPLGDIYSGVSLP